MASIYIYSFGRIVFNVSPIRDSVTCQGYDLNNNTLTCHDDGRINLLLLLNTMLKHH